MAKQQITKYLKLPFQFDEQLLVQDLATIVDAHWTPHLYKGSYKGQWNSIPLYAKDGDASNLFAGQNASSDIQETPLLKKCAYFKEVLSHFKCPMQAVRLLQLSPDSIIKPHRDYRLGYEDNNFRLHIPITTNPDINFILDGNRLKMLPGECWYTNVNFLHSVSNKGSSDRVHLVIDGERNAWSDDLFFSLAPKASFLLPEDQVASPAAIKRIIEELEQLNNPASAQLIMEFREKLKQFQS